MIANSNNCRAPDNASPLSMPSIVPSREQNCFQRTASPAAELAATLGDTYEARRQIACRKLTGKPNASRPTRQSKCEILETVFKPKDGRNIGIGEGETQVALLPFTEIIAGKADNAEFARQPLRHGLR